jgi:ribonuclease Z
LRGASGIYILRKGHGILMDCAEGSYGQIYDHFAKKETVNDIIKRTRIVFITHIHGDHQLGILKILSERDKLFSNSKEASD